MGEKQPSRGSGLVAAGFVIVLLALTFSTILIFAERWWWFPASITTLGMTVDRQFVHTLIITGIVFFLAQLGLAYAIFRYRDRGGRAQYSHGNNVMEIAWTIATAVMFVGLGIAAEASWRDYRILGPAPGALQVEVTGKQFTWNFRYPGPDGQFGRTQPRLINDAGGNPLGLDSNDPAAKDDIVSPVMVVPVNQEVEVILRTVDVTHSFFVRELRFKQDTVPGLVIRMHFNANQTGTYEVVCAELCGLGHYRMRTELQVMTRDAFDNWLREQAAYTLAAEGTDTTGGQN